MIDRLEISGCASYGDAVEAMDGLREVNFVYGANGVGKTTISRLIADCSPFSKCAVHWRRGTQLQPLVYNRDFVATNFDQSGDLRGIFTLGQDNVDTQRRIAQTKGELANITRRIENLTHNLQGINGGGGKRGELARHENSFLGAAWQVKKRHDVNLRGALAGFHNDKVKFKNTLIAECEKKPPATLPTLSEIEAGCSSLFGTTPTIEAPLSTIDYLQLTTWEASPLLTRRILGKTDVDIAAMILRLSNSDWVKQGITYFEASGPLCPFCQQKAPQGLTNSLAEYFDETFARDTSAIAALRDGYGLAGEQVIQILNSAASLSSRFVDVEMLKAEQSIFEGRFRKNCELLRHKCKEPSQSIALESLKEICKMLQDRIEAANECIREHNVVVANLASARSKLVRDVWSFLAHNEALSTFSAYQKTKRELNVTISTLEQQIATAVSEKTAKEAELRRLEKETTSIRPTVEDINKLLKAFGFRSFYLEATSSNFYKLCRPDGSDAKETLSEGERSFITFLYFHHLLKGGMAADGVYTDRVVVFDDPVSSLDCDVLSIVGSLIRQTIEDVRAKRSHIKQVFVLTHNVYFHKEITFHKKRSASCALHDETFWVVRKIDNKSRVKKFTSNPVKTSYELLWSEVRDANPQSPGVQNAMRRILEYYFRILGSVDDDAIIRQFDGEERLICKALFSWVNDGSHSIPDDVFMTFDDGAVQKQKHVFKSVFVKTQHLDHYNMMMGSPFAIESVSA